MTFEEVLSHFQVKMKTGDGYQCICPAHSDNKASLHISRGKGKTLVHCFTGCNTENVLAKVGLEMEDLFDEPLKSGDRWMNNVEKYEKRQIESVYEYKDLSGNYAFTRLRLSGKEFKYGRMEGDRFRYGLNGKRRKDIPAVYCDSFSKLKKAISDGTRVFYCEGEKDVNTLNSRGLIGVTCGASGHWNPACAKLFEGADVVVLADNDEPGKASARAIEKDLRKVSKSVKVVVPTPDIEKGDISDLFETHSVEDLEKLIENTRTETKIRALSMCDVEEEPVEWLVPNYIPSGQISLLVGDGGQGKTSIWCDLVAGITSGRNTILDADNPFDDKREGRRCMFFSSEDSVPKVLKRRLRKAGADESKVLFVDLTDKDFDLIKFDAPELEELIAENRPALCIFDPLQSFIPATVQMGSRNAMRQCMSPLIALGEKYGTSFLIVMHTNKKLGVSGRTRCADSADIWDIARSVLIVGYTGEGDIHYLSHEKSNYAQPEETILYSIDDGRVVFNGTSEKKDRDYVAENSQVSRTAPARDEAKEIILNILSDGEAHRVTDLDNTVKSSGVSFITLKRAKSELKKEGKIRYTAEGFGNTKTFYVKKVIPGE